MSLLLITGFMVVEVVGGILSGSLALLSDAGHMITDAMSIGLALLAMWVADRPSSAEHTFGYRRAEVLAAMFNALSLWRSCLGRFPAVRSTGATLPIRVTQ